MSLVSSVYTMKRFKIKDWFCFLDLDGFYDIFLEFYLWNKINPFSVLSININFPINYSWEWQYSGKVKKEVDPVNDIFYSPSWDDRVTEYKFFYKALGFFSVSIFVEYFV